MISFIELNAHENVLYIHDLNIFYLNTLSSSELISHINIVQYFHMFI